MEMVFYKHLDLIQLRKRSPEYSFLSINDPMVVPLKRAHFTVAFSRTPNKINKACEGYKCPCSSWTSFRLFNFSISRIFPLASNLFCNGVKSRPSKDVSKQISSSKLLFILCRSKSITVSTSALRLELPIRT